MAVATELSRLLKSDGEPFEKRLCLAQNVYLSSQIAIPNKEEIIVGWLCRSADTSLKKKRLSSNNSGPDVKDIWKTLRSCISSSRVHRFSVLDLRPSSKRDVIQVLCKHLQGNYKDKNDFVSLFDCVLCILESHSFQRYLRQEIPLFCDFLQSALSSVQNAGAEDNLKLSFLMALRTFYRESVIRSDLNTLFIKAALFPLTGLIDADDKLSSVLASEVKKCFEQILFPKSSVETIQFLDSLFHVDRKVPDLKSTKTFDKEKYPIPVSIIDALGESLDLFDEKRVVLLYRMVLESFISSLKNTSISSAFHMFVGFCHLVGVRIHHGKCKINYKKIQESVEKALPNPTGLSLSVLKSLVDVLVLKNVPLNSEISGTTFLDWLQMLVERLFPHDAELIEKSEFIKLMASFTRLNPFIVEANVENIISFVTSKPLSPAEKPAYSELLKVLFKMYHKMNRIHKVLDVFLTCLEKGILNHSFRTNEKPLNATDWIPSEVCEEFSEFVSAMPSGSAISTFEVLIVHLKKSIDLSFSSTHIEGDGDKILLQVVCELLCAVLKGVRMVENSLAPHPRTGFCKILGDLKDCLYVMGQSLLKVSSLRSFLQISYYWAAEALLIRLYSTVGRSSLLESIGSSGASTCARVSLAYMHPYLTDDEWQQLCGKVAESEDVVCADSLVQLDFQLLSALQLLENPLPAETTTLVERCLASILNKSKTNSDASFLSKEMVLNMVLLSRMLGTSEVVDLAECLIHPLLSQLRCNLPSDTGALLTERRTLASALIFSTLGSLERALKALKRKKSEHTSNRFTVSRAVLVNLKSCYNLLVEAETNQSSEASQPVKTVFLAMVESVSEQLKVAVKGTKEGNEEHLGDVNLTAIKDHLDLLQTLPFQGLMVHSRFAIFLSCISLALDCSNCPPSSERTHILSLLYDHILVGLAERKLFLQNHEHLSQLQLDRYLAHVVVKLGVSRLLLKMLVAEAVEGERSLDFIVEMVAILNKKFSKSRVNSENILLATVLLQTLVGRKRLFETSSDSKKEEGQSEKVRVALENLVDVLCKLIEEQNFKPKESMHLYALTLDFLVKSKAITKITQSLAPHFEDYCSLAVSKLQSSNADQCKDAEVLLSTVFAHHKVLHEYIPSSLLRDVWIVLIQAQKPSEGPVKLLSQYVSKDILDELLFKTVEAYRSPAISSPEISTSNLMELWCALLNCSSSVKANSELWQNAVRLLLDDLHSLNSIPPNLLLDFVHKLVSTSEIVMDMEMIDQCLLALNEIQLPVTIAEFVSSGDKYLSVLSAFFFHRQVFALDCVPNLFQKLQYLIRKLGNLSRVRNDLSQENTALLSDLAYNVEKFISSFTRPDFKVALKRVAAYLIADIISVFEVVTLCSSVKVHFQNIIYILFSMIDKHSVQFLLRAMSPASNEIFKTLLTSYNKFHAFKGKI